MRGRSLPYRLIVLIVGSTSMIFILLVAYYYQTTKKIMKAEVETSIISISKQAISVIREELRRIENIVGNYSSFLLNREAESADDFQNVLIRLTNSDSLILGASAITRMETANFLFEYSCIDGQFAVHSDPDYIQNKSALYRNGLWSDPHFDSFYQEEVVSYKKLVNGIQGDSLFRVGEIIVDIPLNWINNIMNSVEVFESGLVFLVTSDGLFVTHPDKRFIGKKTIEHIATERNAPQLLAIIDSIGAGKSGYLDLKSYLGGTEKGMITYQPVFENGWSIIFLFNQREYLADLNRITQRVIWIGISFLAVLTGIYILIIRRLTMPITYLTRLTDRIRKGEFDVYLPDMPSQGEAGMISESLRSLQKELKKYIDNLGKTILEKEKIESDIRIAAQIQGDLIPKEFPDPSCLKGFEVYGRVIPARWVSGDLFDFRRIGDDHLFFMIGDVAGKGVPASLFMAITRTLVLNEIKRESNPARIMETVNDHLCHNNPSSVFVTAILGMIRLSTGLLDYCNAGHNFPYLLSGLKKLTALDRGHGPPLGILSGESYQSDTFQMNRGDVLMLYTDGIVEAENTNGEFFKEKRLESYLRSTASTQKRSEDMVLDLIDQVQRFTNGAPRNDDMTLLVFSRH